LSNNEMVEQLERDGLVAPAGAAVLPIPAPTNPMGVARRLARDLYTDDNRLQLRTHRGDFYRYDGTCWPEAEARGVRGAIYEYLDQAVYEKATKAVIEIVPWEPTRRKIDDVLDALKAIAHLDGSSEPPS